MSRQREVSNILILIFVGLFLLGAMFLTASDTENAHLHCVPLDEGWQVTINGIPCSETAMDSLSFPAVNRGDRLVLETVLPTNVVSNPIFVFYSVHSALTVQLDGNEIYRYGTERYDEGRMLGYGYQFIDLPENYEGKKLTLNLSVSEDAAFSSFDMPKLYDANWYTRDYLKENRIPLIINLFLIVFGICITIITLILIARLRSIQWIKLLCVALFSAEIGLWSLCSFNLTFIFNDNLLWKTMTEFGSFYLLPISVFAYFYEDVVAAEGKFRRGIYYAILVLQVVFTVTVYVLQIAGLCHFPQLLWVQHVILVLMALYLIYLFTSDIRHKRFNSAVLCAGTIILIVFGAMDLLRFNFEKFIHADAGNKYVGMLNIGVMIFITSLLLDFSRSIIHALVSAARGKALEELAYTDALTGLANKRSCEDAFDALNETPEEEKQYAIGVFDLNNLKKVNDHLGHEEGDAFIHTFAEILKEIFAPSGLVGRTGGDEFLVILNHTTKEEIASMLAKMEEMMQEANREHAGWQLSTAYGFCEYREEPGLDAKQLCKIADARMYEHKKAMKAQR